MRDEPIQVSGGAGGGAAPDAADLDEKVVAAAVARGLITAPQGRSALEEARRLRVPVLERLREKGLLAEQDAADLDQETREDFVPGYRVLSKLGEGGMGVVYRALQKRLDRVVALKVVTPQLSADASYLRRFEREAKAVAKLNHPNIVAAYDYGESRGRVYFAMEFVEGTNLAEEVQRSGAFAEDRALAVVRDVAAGLAHAAAAGIIHRDIKPANILLASRAAETGAHGISGAKVTDLGLARSGGTGASELTAAGTILGTPGFMAPEQAFGGDVDFRADIYGLGATLYQVVTGERPFNASTPVGVLARQQAERLADPRDLRAGLSPGLVALLQGMMARRADARYGSYRDLLADIDRVRGGQPPARPLPEAADRTISDPGVPRPEPSAAGGTLAMPTGARATTILSPPTPAPASPGRSRRPVLAAAAALLIAGAALAVYLGNRDGGGPRDGPNTGPGSPEDPPPPATAPDAAGDAAMGEAEAALARSDPEAAMERLEGMRKRFEALPPEARQRNRARIARLDQALKKAREMAADQVKGLWEEGKYEEALQRARRLAGKMPGQEGAAAMAPYLTKLEAAARRGSAERQSLVQGRTAAKNRDPFGVFAALEDFEKEYGEFSPSLVEVRGLLAEARLAAPEVVLGSDPPGATVLTGGKDLGKTPLRRRFPAGDLPVELRLEGYRPLARTVTLARGDEGKPFSWRLEPLPPPDPEPARVLAPEGDPFPLWNGNLGSWKFAGAWRGSEAERTCPLDGAERPEPAGSLRGSRSSGLGTAERNFPARFASAAGWKIEWQMVGEHPKGLATARVELHFAAREDGRALVLGLDDDGAYLGARDLAGGALDRTHEEKKVRAGVPHTFVVENHGGVFRAFVDGKRIGAVKGAGARVLRVAVEDGAGYFSDMFAWGMAGR